MKLAIKSLALSTATLSLMLGVANNAQAALITGVTASTDMGSFGPNGLAPAVNGTGLPGNTPSLTGVHGASNGINSWLSSFGVSTGNVTFDLNGTYNLEGFSFWNYSADNLAGINGVTVQASTDGVNFTPITGAPTQFTQGNLASSQSPEQFTFSPVVASFVRFVINSNFGTTTTGFSEVQFDGTPITQSVPEPSTLVALLTLGLAGLSLRKKI